MHANRPVCSRSGCVNLLAPTPAINYTESHWHLRRFGRRRRALYEKCSIDETMPITLAAQRTAHMPTVTSNKDRYWMWTSPHQQPVGGRLDDLVGKSTQNDMIFSIPVKTTSMLSCPNQNAQHSQHRRCFFEKISVNRAQLSRNKLEERRCIY